MSMECPSTKMFLHLHKKFHEQLNKLLEQPKRKCFFRSVEDTPLCPINYLKGKIAEHAYNKVKKDANYTEDVRRGLVKDLSILFADIRGFTSRTADMPPDKIITLLDLFIPEMFNIIINRHSGMVNKLLGDGIMAIYGHPYHTGEEIVRAIHSAIDMQQAAAALDQALSAAGYDPVQIGVGINCGDVLLCEVGDDRYRETTVIGSPVNLAAKMEDVAEAQEIVLPHTALVPVESARPSMARYFQEKGTASGVKAMVFDWMRYIEKECTDVEDWQIQ
ncbi:MAG: adenylate/guanylate cyclase domain-containing protein [Deltaproteobacteria bacterium]|nr:adenylate/guanylate cyclase domain-containing protein [Deltaproteobacteria bacterium]